MGDFKKLEGLSWEREFVEVVVQSKNVRRLER